MEGTNIYTGVLLQFRTNKSDQDLFEEALMTNNLIHRTGNLIPFTRNDLTHDMDVDNGTNKITDEIDSSADHSV